MKIRGIVWLDEIVDKLYRQHHVHGNEVREILQARPRFRFIEKGHRRNENVYSAMGQTTGGRYLIIFFVLKRKDQALVLSARDMTQAERKRHAEK